MDRLDESHQFLLLLPNPPSEVSISSLKVAYGPALTYVLQELAQISARSTGAVLNIVVAYHDLPSLDYTSTQKIFGLMYRLTCLISTERSIDVQFGNDVDTRVILTYSRKNGNFDITALGANRFNGLARIATQSLRRWSHVYSEESEVGDELLQNFLTPQKASMSLSKPDYTVTRVPGGLAMHNSIYEDGNKTNRASYPWSPHRSVAVGGTFDHLHAGHKLLLTMAALVLDPVEDQDSSDLCLTIGISGDELLSKKKYPEELEDWRKRQSSVRAFVIDFLSYSSPRNVLDTSEDVTNPESSGREILDRLQSGLSIRYKEIFDPFGPTITDPDITALVISAETRAGGKAVNDKRAERGWHSLEVFEVEVLDADEGDEVPDKDDFEGKISSTEIRSRIRQKKEIVSGNE